MVILNIIMMKKYKLLVLSVLLQLSLVSCKEKTHVIEDDKVVNATAIEDYFEFFNSPTNGSILVQSFETNASGRQSYTITSSFDGNRIPFDFRVEDKMLSFDNYFYNESNNKSSAVITDMEIQEFYGNNFTIDFESNAAVLKDSQSGADSTASLYIPDLIHVQFSGLDAGKVVVGSTISWNFDGSNENGVVIAFEYSPYSQYDEEISSQYPEGRLGGISVADNGEYVIKESDLQYLPNNALVSVYVGRAGFLISNDGNGNTFSIAGYTVSNNEFYIQK